MTLLRALCLLATLLLSCPVPATAAAGPEGSEPIRRNGYLSVTLTPLLYESSLQDPAYGEALDQMFRGRVESFAAGLAEGLENTAFSGNLRVLPGYHADEHNELRSVVEPDHFLISLDLNANYGLTNGSSLAACLSGASCFLLSPIEMFTYRSSIEASLNTFYITPEGKRIRLVQDRRITRNEISGDFFDAMDLARELEWITLLTDEGLNALRRELLADLPTELMWRAWSKAGDALSQPPPRSAQGRLLPPALAPPAETPLSTKGQAAAQVAALEPPRGVTLQEVVRQASPSVFKVRTGDAVGSGFVLSRRGFGLTSLHVVDGAETVTVHFHGGKELPARVILTEPGLDLAVLSFNASNLIPLPLGDSDQLMVGDEVTAIGYPRDLGLSVVQGKVSSLEPYQGTPLIRVEADLPPGNSGGPLLNAQGEGVGINFLRSIAAGDTTAFGIPINLARATFAHLLDSP